MQHILNSIADFERIKKTKKAFILYITDELCNVGESVGSKLEKLIAEQFPKLPIYYTYTSQTPELSAQLSIFTIPTVLVFFEGKLYIQKSRAFSLDELGQEIDRYYKMMF
jgi:thioredoxin-like negative regulator of GroEL